TMPQITHYDELTWPEVAALPRDLPLVLPLGDGYDATAIARALGRDDFCLLPALPYGWQGSVAPVTPAMLQRVVTGIFSGPSEEGFTRLVVLHSGDEDVESEGVTQLRLERDGDEPPPLKAT